MKDISLIVEYLLIELGKRQKQNGAGMAPFCIASVVASDSICVSAAARRKRPQGRRIPRLLHPPLLVGQHRCLEDRYHQYGDVGPHQPFLGGYVHPSLLIIYASRLYHVYQGSV